MHVLCKCGLNATNGEPDLVGEKTTLTSLKVPSQNSHAIVAKH